MRKIRRVSYAPMVALRKESVDRNQSFAGFAVQLKRSLSARRAWIEIPLGTRSAVCRPGRSPQGERG